MRIIFLFVVIAGICSNVAIAQISGKSTSELKVLKQKAVAAEDYEMAAKYKKAIELNTSIKKAVGEEDYETAARLKKELNALDGTSQVGSSQPMSSSTSNFTSSEGVEFYNVVYLLDRNTENVRQLERQTAKIETSSYSAVYVAGSSSYWTVDGYASPVQLVKDDNVTFVVKVGSGVDPASIFKLYRLELGGKKDLKRKYLSFKTTAGAYSGASTTQNIKDELDLNFVKRSNDQYEIVFNQELVPGEYAFVFGVTWYMFGVKNSVSTNPNIQVSPAISYSPTDIYKNEIGGSKLVYLGVDYSLLKVKSDKYLGTDDVVKMDLDKAVDRFSDDYVRHGKMEDWLGKKGSTIYCPGFGKIYSANNVSDQIVTSNSVGYNMDAELIANHIGKYDINCAGVGMVIIPTLIDSQSKQLTSFVVWFDFDSRQIISSTQVIIPSDASKSLTSRSLAVDFLNVFKRYIDRTYKPERPR